jgi:hypothetical protein
MGQLSQVPNLFDSICCAARFQRGKLTDQNLGLPQLISVSRNIERIVHYAHISVALRNKLFRAELLRVRKDFRDCGLFSKLKIPFTLVDSLLTHDGIGLEESKCKCILFCSIRSQDSQRRVGMILRT